MTIQTIINSTMKRLKQEGKLLTPDTYAEAFCKEAKKAKMNIEDCDHLLKFTKRLNADFQKDLSNYHIQSMNEFVCFLIAKLNRTNPTQASDTIEAYILLAKKVFQAIEVLHNREAADLARKGLEILNLGASSNQIDSFRQLWVNFLTTYDDTFLQKLKNYGNIDSKNLRKTIENLHIVDGEKIQSSELSFEKISKLLTASFVPSIASSVNDTISEISQKIRNHPDLLEKDTIEKEIKRAIALRIALDKESVKGMMESIDGVLDQLSLHLIDMIESSDNSNDEIQEIKKELESYTEESSSNFQTTHKKLYTIALALEENTQTLSNDLKGHSSEVTGLSSRVKKLEKDLESAKKELKEDFLTKLSNRRALNDYMKVKEAEFKRYERNYSLVMFDLDNFKNVNDTYGHDTGDAILVAFAKILTQECRRVDIIGRYGGEEFIALLSETDMQGAVAFAQKVRKKVEHSHFIYKSNRIEITVSAGVAERKKYASFEATLKASDNYLYIAKNSGRNRVEHKK